MARGGFGGARTVCDGAFPVGTTSRLSKERRNNLLAPLLTGVVGLARAYFGYYILRAEKTSRTTP